MWYCKNGHENSDNYNFCAKCGLPKNTNQQREKTLDRKIVIIAACLIVIAALSAWILFLPDPLPTVRPTSTIMPTVRPASTPVPTAKPTLVPAATSAPKYIWSEWSSWSTNPVSSSSTREVETRQGRTLIGYNMVHYGTQQAVEPYYRMFRDYSINGNFDKYGARASYAEKHLTKYVSVAQMNWAVSYPANGAFINLTYNGESYGGFQMGTSTAYNFGDDNKVWYIESEKYSVVTEYRHRDLVTIQ